MNKFKISKDLSLPVETITQAISILGRRGSGKTNTAVVLAERMLECGYPIVVLDPLGVWWGLRSSSDGKGPGYPVIIFGGEHADVPLQPTGGKLVADFVVRERQPVILDLFGFGENDMRRFVADFATQFYKTNREAIHWFVDEADEFAPQSPSGGPGAACLGAMQNIVRRGRAKGIGVTLITQRSAVLNKSVLTQTECLVAMQTTGPHDLKAIDEWIKYHGTPEEREAIMKSLTSLERGDAWFYSPSWLKLLKKVHVSARSTFDSSQTPKAGEARREPKRLADVDLVRVAKQMAATVEEAKANDPKELRKQIAELQKQLKGQGSDPKALESAESRGEQRGRQAAQAEIKQLREAVCDRESRLAKVDDLLIKAAKLAHLNGEALGPVSVSPPKVVQSARQAPAITRPAARPITEPAAAIRPDGFNLNKAQQRIVDSLAWLESIEIREPSNIQLGAVALIDTTGGYFSNLVGPLSTNGLVTRSRGCLCLTDAGRALAQPMEDVATLDDYHEMLRGRLRKLKSAAGKSVEILNVMIAHAGEEMTTEQIGAEIGVDHTGGYFSNLIGPLSTLGLIKRDRGNVAPTSILFPDNLA